MANQAEEKKDDRLVSPKQLAAVLADADRIVVGDSRMRGAETIFESSDRSDLDALSVALVIEKPVEWFHCMCLGSPVIYLYKNDKLLARVTNHHGRSVRCSLWDSDALIVDNEKWLQWFDDRQMNGPRNEVEAARTRRKQTDEQRESGYVGGDN